MEEKKELPKKRIFGLKVSKYFQSLIMNKLNEKKAKEIMLSAGNYILNIISLAEKPLNDQMIEEVNKPTINIHKNYEHLSDDNYRNINVNIYIYIYYIFNIYLNNKIN
jgi:hypothetical protein